MAGLMNMFDISGAMPAFNAGMMAGKAGSPVAGVGDAIREVMGRMRSQRDQQMQFGQGLMQTQFTQDVKDRSDATKMDTMRKNFAAQGAGATGDGVQRIVERDPTSGRLMYRTVKPDYTHGVMESSNWAPLTTQSVEQEFKDQQYQQLMDEMAAEKAANAGQPQVGSGGIAGAQTPITQDQKRAMFQDALKNKLSGKK